MRTFFPAAGAVLAAALALLPDTAAAQTQEVQDWKVTCDGGTCAAHYDGQGVRMVVGRSSSSGDRRIAFLLSPNSAQGEPVAIRLDSGWQAGLVVARCDERSCQATVSASQQALIEQAFARAREGVIAYKANDRLVIAPISLMGFSAASGMVR